MDPRVLELHCIMPLVNIPSVMQHGILSYDRASKLSHHSVALQPVQDKRDQVQIPGGLKLHQYANFYFHARNPMMYKRKDEAHGLCVLQVSAAALALDGTVITDCNAASTYVRFLSPAQWELLNFDDIFAMDWRHLNNAARYYQHRSRKCAEVLVPHRLQPGLIVGAYVVSEDVGERLSELDFSLPINVEPVLFFA